MFSHIFIGVTDFERALALYERLMAAFLAATRTIVDAAQGRTARVDSALHPAIAGAR